MGVIEVIDPLRVYAEVQRIRDLTGDWLRDQNGNCIMIRNRTKLLFGKEDVLLGSVILTNPVPMKLIDYNEWTGFRNGEGTEEKAIGIGRACPELRIIMDVIIHAYCNVLASSPAGYVNVYYISNVVCTKKEHLFHAHGLIEQSNLRGNLNQRIFLQDSFNFFDADFVLLGFRKSLFEKQTRQLMERARTSSNTVYVEDESGWGTHPYCWGPFPEVKQNITRKLMRVLEERNVSKIN